MGNPNSKKEMKIQLMEYIENSDLTIRSRIDLKKKVQNGKIENIKELENCMKQIEENPMKENHQRGSNSSLEILEYIVNKSNLKKSYKNHYLKKIKKGEITDKFLLIKEIENDQNKLFLLSSLEKSNLKDFSKNKIKKLINNNTVSDYKTLRQEIKKETGEEIKLDKLKNKREKRRIEAINKRDLMSKLNKIKLNEASRMVIEGEIKKGKIKTQYELNSRINEIRRNVSKRNKELMRKNRKKEPKKSSSKPRKTYVDKGYSEDYRYFKDLYG